MGQQDEIFCQTAPRPLDRLVPPPQRSLGRLSALYLVMLAPLLQLLDNLCMALNVIRKWLAQLYMTSPSIVHPQVLPAVAWSVKVLPATKQGYCVFVTALTRVSSVSVLVKRKDMVFVELQVFCFFILVETNFLIDRGERGKEAKNHFFLKKNAVRVMDFMSQWHVS